MDTKQAILAATITCIERKGLHKTTSRDIAAEAGVNVAAINYHFGTKAALTERAMALTVENGMEDFQALLMDLTVPFKLRVRRFYECILHGGMRYPNITRAHLHGTIIDGQPPGPYLLRLQELIERALDSVSPDDTLLSRPALASALETGMCAVLMRCLQPRLFTMRGSFSIEEEARRLVRLIPD